jgi:hypothetical protein
MKYYVIIIYRQMKSKPGGWHINSFAHILELLALYCAEHFSHARIKQVTIDRSHQANGDQSDNHNSHKHQPLSTESTSLSPMRAQASLH